MIRSMGVDFVDTMPSKASKSCLSMEASISCNMSDSGPKNRNRILYFSQVR